MSEVFRKLNVKNAAEILLLHAPASFESALASLGVPVVLWFAYPTQSARRSKCEFNLGTGCASLTCAGFESVRTVAIDENGSARRFRRNAFVRAHAR
jgi:hypothetical protein